MASPPDAVTAMLRDEHRAARCVNDSLIRLQIGKRDRLKTNSVKIKQQVVQFLLKTIRRETVDHEQGDQEIYHQI